MLFSTCLGKPHWSWVLLAASITGGLNNCCFRSRRKRLFTWGGRNAPLFLEDYLSTLLRAFAMGQLFWCTQNWSIFVSLIWETPLYWSTDRHNVAGTVNTSDNDCRSGWGKYWPLKCWPFREGTSCLEDADVKDCILTTFSPRGLFSKLHTLISALPIGLPSSGFFIASYRPRMTWCHKKMCSVWIPFI